jgi:predicted nucleic acid-binding protein
LKYVLDTSALVAYALDQRGADEVEAFIRDSANQLFISALSLFDLAGVLKKEGGSAHVVVHWQTYRQLADIIPVDATLAEAAWELREKIGTRLPMADAVIAATAQSLGATLVHRDQHLAAIPVALIPQFRLPAA